MMEIITKQVDFASKNEFTLKNVPMIIFLTTWDFAR